jgi:DNA-binding CsgD family transcriptional regulator
VNAAGILPEEEGEGVATGRLTARELQILQLIGEGRTSRDIAHALAISLWTVSNHRKHVCSKLNIHSTAELVAYAVNRAISGAPHQISGTACALQMDFCTPGGRVRISYHGHIQEKPATVTLRIGKTTLHF